MELTEEMKALFDEIDENLTIKQVEKLRQEVKKLQKLIEEEEKEKSQQEK